LLLEVKFLHLLVVAVMHLGALFKITHPHRNIVGSDDMHLQVELAIVLKVLNLPLRDQWFQFSARFEPGLEDIPQVGVFDNELIDNRVVLCLLTSGPDLGDFLPQVDLVEDGLASQIRLSILQGRCAF